MSLDSPIIFTISMYGSSCSYLYFGPILFFLFLFHGVRSCLGDENEAKKSIMT